MTNLWFPASKRKLKSLQNLAQDFLDFESSSHWLREILGLVVFDLLFKFRAWSFILDLFLISCLNFPATIKQESSLKLRKT